MKRRRHQALICLQALNNMSLLLNKPETKNKFTKKIVVFLVAFIVLFSSFNISVEKAQAQLPVTDALSLSWSMGGTFWQKATRALGIVLQKAGSMAFQQVLRSALNKIAYDTANYLGSGGQGQKPMFITNPGEYLANISDEALGQFVESFVGNLNAPADPACDVALRECQAGCLGAGDQSSAYFTGPVQPDVIQKVSTTADSNCLADCKQQATRCATRVAPSGTDASGTPLTSNQTAINQSHGQTLSSFNVCQPSSLEAKLKIGLGLAEQSRPTGPNCTASEMYKNWETGISNKINDWNDPNFLDKFASIFDPRSNDLGIYLLARTDASSKAVIDTKKGEDAMIKTKGWVETTDVAGNLVAPPGEAENANKEAKTDQKNQFGKVTGDILVDTANIFLNQLFMSAFSNLMGSLGKKTSDINKALSSGSGSSYTDDPNIVYGEPQLKQITAKLLTPNFGVNADYDILSELVICLNPQNPGPTNCVIDDKFLQGVSEKKTVIEAIKGGYLHGDWLFSSEVQASSYSSSYSLRNISILRKYRILPVGWEEAAKKIGASTNIKATLMDLVSCFDATDEYNQFSNNFDSGNQGWCRGLVDPNWVLKAPANYCKKQGISAQITNKDIIPGMKGNSGVADTLSTLSLTRAEDYCADNQSCIKEKSNGSCEVYGYCNEEKRTWNFGDDSCDPNYNTCQSFVNTSNNQSISYLQNTLDYGFCTPESAGCKRYSINGTYSVATGTVSWSNSSVSPNDDDIYLNRSTKTCTSKDEGCTELIRVKPTWGANLVMNSDFVNEDDFVGASSTGNKLNDWSLFSAGGHKATIVDASLEPGGNAGKALKLESTGGAGQLKVYVSSSPADSLIPVNTETIIGQSYTLSADVYLASGDHAYVVLGPDEDGFVATTTTKNSWQHIMVTRRASSTYSVSSFNIHGDSNNSSIPLVFYVKNIKLELSNWDTGYSSYGSSKTYEKLIPKYLESVCYKKTPNDYYRLKDDAPIVCTNYARRCNKDEVGCELYKSVKNNFTVSAQVQDTDYCPGECLGYDTYITKETYFNYSASENLIPTTATACSAAAAGCNEFTNLDEINQGGENREYYTRLKQCVKPGSDCASFYAWEGTNNGYQLKAYSLKKDSSGGPEVTGTGSECNARIYNLTINDPEYNPDCLEFYNSAGEIFYRLSSLVITCSENCHAYRMNNSVAPCKNAGDDAWSTTHNACIYWAIPGEGKTCAALEKGCREYNGNNGNNTRVAARFNFENGQSGWYSNCQYGVAVSTISNGKNGHSLKYNNGSCETQIGEGESQAKSPKLPIIKELLATDSAAAQLKANGLVSTGKSYSLKFIATSNSSNSVNLQIYFKNVNAATSSYFETVTIAPGTDWGIYETNLNNLDHEIGADEVLVITGSSSFYFDDLILTEITDRYYLIKDSAVTPDICSYDVYDNYVGPLYNLGCSQYIDRSNVKNNIHKFSKLCNGESVGCEQMISTNNYTPYGGNIWKDKNANDPDPLEPNGVCDSDEPSCVKIGRHQMIYAVYDATKKCNASMKGCSRLGEGRGTTTNMVWSDVYKKNDPNEYDKILCSQDELGCDEWQNVGGNGYSYFKDPGNEACVYRAANSATTAEKSWYKIPVKRCDLAPNTPDGVITAADYNISSSTCVTSADCEDEKPCIVDNNDYLCATSTLKTIGYGGQGNQIATPSSTAALCVPASSGCTEYIDPISQFSPNLVKNPDFLTINETKEEWSSSGQQDIVLEPNKLYIFGVSSESGSNSGAITLQFPNGKTVKPLLFDNTFGTSTNALKIEAGSLRHLLFNSMTNTSAKVIGGAEGKTIEVRAAVVDYQLQKNLDKKVCNGLVDFGKGCILFNERTINGSKGLISLANGWDAYATLAGKAPTSCDASSTGSCNSNNLIKVDPNRVCSKWLDCTNYVINPDTKEKICYSVGECTKLNDKNECDHFVTATSTNRVFSVKYEGNATGYSLLDKYYVGQMKEVGLNSELHYDFEEDVPALNCSRADGGGACNFNKNIAKDLLVREPENSPVDYPAHGRTYLRVPSEYLIYPSFKNGGAFVFSGKTYYINYLINTKNSGLLARLKIHIYGEGNNEIYSTFFDDVANNGWERKIHSFDVGATGKRVLIELGTSSGGKGFVYFDDINIEPVLEIGQDSDGKDIYAARECRLYSKDDSLTCTSKNNNVISDGLEGYCLEHDPENPSVCLLWYPIDKIGSTIVARSDFGYQGKFPLNYCTLMNADFDLVAKRQVFFAKGEESSGGCKNNLTPYESKTQEMCGEHWQRYVAVRYEYKPRGWDNCWGDWFCVPREKSLTIKSYLYNEDQGCSWSPGEQINDNTMGQGYEIKLPTPNRYVSGSSINGGSCGNSTRIESVDGEGWFLYSNYSQVPTLGNKPDLRGLSKEETANADPPVRVYDYTAPPADEESLKLIASTNHEDVYRFRCDQFTQVVDNNGENKAWTARVGISSIYATQTPPYFLDENNRYYGDGSNSSFYKISRYGRNREDSPFGAALWPDNYDLLNGETIKFRNQYSKEDSETALAGRPYSCTGASCGSVGYCSLDPNVFCIFANETSADYVSKKTCADKGLGTCVRIWSSPLIPEGSSARRILKNLFWRPYNTFEYSYSDRIYSATNTPLSSKPNECEDQKRIVSNYNQSPPINPNNTSYCGIFPQVSNLKMFYGSTKTPVVVIDDEVIIGSKGVYRLEFNSLVDEEQQPLKEINIFWEGGIDSEQPQIITGDNHHPDEKNPHVFYHYYSTIGPRKPKIVVYDNWGFWGGGCSFNSCLGLGFIHGRD